MTASVAVWGLRKAFLNGLSVCLWCGSSRSWLPQRAENSLGCQLQAKPEAAARGHRKIQGAAESWEGENTECGRARKDTKERWRLRRVKDCGLETAGGKKLQKAAGPSCCEFQRTAQLSRVARSWGAGHWTYRNVILAAISLRLWKSRARHLWVPRLSWHRGSGCPPYFRGIQQKECLADWWYKLSTVGSECGNAHRPCFSHTLFCKVVRQTEPWDRLLGVKFSGKTTLLAFSLSQFEPLSNIPISQGLLF